MSDQYVAQTIFNQLGGGVFKMMTGAKLGFDEKSLTAKFPRGLSPISAVRIELAADDTYTVSFFKGAGRSLRVLKEVDGIFCDMLRDLVSRETGLALSLGGRS